MINKQVQFQTKTEIQNRIASLKADAHKWQASQYRSSQMNDARGIFACERQLEVIWKNLDAARAALASEPVAYTLPIETLLAR